ncbi:hypothetical protein MMC17_000273 [Xylographa soralifera]|nr:hypothetical protein [Xylographa soralifera]
MWPPTFHPILLITLASLALTSSTKEPHNAHAHTQASSTSSPNPEKPHPHILDSLQHILASLQQPPPLSPPAPPNHETSFRLDPHSFSSTTEDHSVEKQDLHHHEAHKKADKPQPAPPEPPAEPVAQGPA